MAIFEGHLTKSVKKFTKLGKRYRSHHLSGFGGRGSDGLFVIASEGFDDESKFTDSAVSKNRL